MNDFLDFAKQQALDAGEVMLEHFQMGIDVSVKSDNTPVTIADTKINNQVIEAIKAAYPSHAVIGEEKSHEVAKAEYTWICDPIDGTVPYTLGVPVSVFSLGLVSQSNGQPVIAVIYDPYQKRMYTAIKGQGAYLNDKPISVNTKNKLEDAIIGLSGGRSKVVDQAEFKRDVIAQCFRPIILNCVMYEAMLVATGQIGANIFPGHTAHDAVTAKLIVEEAGGRVTDVFGNEQRYDQPVQGAIFSNSQLHDQLIAITKNHEL